MAAWRKFAIEVIGLMEGAPGADGSVRLRIDERPFRIAVVPGKHDRFLSCGWEFRDAAELDATVGTLRGGQSGGAPRHATRRRTTAAVRQIAFCADPCGNQLELFHGRTYDYAPFASPRGPERIRRRGTGHGARGAAGAAAGRDARQFYQQLGFADTDEMWLAMSPEPGRSEARHSLHACRLPPPSQPGAGRHAGSRSGCVHIMLEARTLDDVGYALDRCVAAGAHISSSLGKHSNDFMVSFYVQTPGGFDLEFGCDGLQPDWSTWVPTQSVIGDLWGHRWSPPPS